MKISGVGVVNANQEATVSLIAGSIVENLTSNINKSDLGIESGQESKQEEKSGQSEAIKAVADMIGGIFKGIMGMWMIIIVGLIAAVFMFPGLFCKIPPLAIPMNILGLCSKKNSSQSDSSYPPQYQPMPQYQPIPQYQPMPQYQPQPPQYQYQPPQYSDIIVQKNNV